MIKMSVDSRAFAREMKNVMEYSIGYLEGIQRGKNKFFTTLGLETIEMLKTYIDANARVNPQILQHMYEWNKSGDPGSRLYDIDYTVSNLGLSIKSTFRQSKTVKDGSTVPFYDKARIMENGIPVVIRPRKSSVLVFDDNGEQVFTKGPITVENPGGTAAQNGFENTIDTFFNRYFTQSFLRSSGIGQYLENPELYKRNLKAGKRGGRMTGLSTGYTWIANAGVVA